MNEDSSKPAAVIIYGREGCPFTRKALEAYRGKGLPVEFHNPGLEKEFLGEFLRLSPKRKIPVIVEGNQVLIGFDGT